MEMYSRDPPLSKTGVHSETPPKNVTGYKIFNSLWTGLGILSPVTFLEAWLGVSERTPEFDFLKVVILKVDF